MKKTIKQTPVFLWVACIILLTTIESCKNAATKSASLNAAENNKKSGTLEEYDQPDKAAMFEFMRTKDLTLNLVPIDQLLLAKEQTMQSMARSTATMSGYGNWVERGPNNDVAGPYGNPRDASNIASTSGRIRATLVDAADVSGKTVFVAGIDGGIWMTTDITASPATWTALSDFLTNLAVSSFTQDPTNTNTLYAATGESFYNIDAVNGVGVFKSTDHGNTWALLSATTNYKSCTKIVCDASGNVYLATRSLGLLRSNNGGGSWTTITPSGMVADICDLKISATGRLHVVSGISSTQSYRYTDIPSTATSTSYTAPATPFPSYNNRAEIAVSGNTLYALPVDGSNQVPTIYKSVDGGGNWAATAAQPGGGPWASGQGWYALSVDINPANINQCIVGGLDNYKTIDGGASWTKISQWYGSGAPYVHADNHKITWYNGGNKLIIADDGGIFYSSDGGNSFVDKNNGLRIKQFYSVAAHPTNLNYFLAGAQDNGVHQFSSAGLSSTVEVTGGDGAYTAIDQINPAFQFGSYVYNTYRRSIDGGANWSSINFYLGSSVSHSNLGNFINVFSLDNSSKIMYAAGEAGKFFRWTNPETQAAGNYYAGGTPFWPATASQVALTALNSASVLAITVSPYTSDRVYFGTSSGSVCYADAASSIVSGSAGTSINTGLPVAAVSSIAIGTTDNNLMVSYSNYGANSIWVSSNNGTTWTSIEGNLPDMPVRWCMFAPGNDNKAIIATETGVWFTQALNGASTVWSPSLGFPSVRTDMLAYRSADGTVAAATHGRGLWTQTANSILPLNNFSLRGNWTANKVELNWSYENLPGSAMMDVEASTDAAHYTKVASLSKGLADNYHLIDNAPLAAQNLYYRIKATEQNGNIKYSNIVKLFKGYNAANGMIEIINLYPNPVVDKISIGFNVPEKGQAVYSIIAANGQVVWSMTAAITFVGNYNISENVGSLKPGTYIFTISLNGKKSSKIFIKK